MTLTCKSFSTAVLPNGRIQLTLDAAQADAMEERLSVKEIATLLRLQPSSILKLSTRKKKPLPLIRGNGRPYGLRSRINDWLTNAHLDLHMGLARKVYGG